MTDSYIQTLFPLTYQNVAYIKRESISGQLYLTFKNANVKIDSNFLDMTSNPINNISKLVMTGDCKLENIKLIDFNNTSATINHLRNLNFSTSTSTTINNLNNLNFSTSTTTNINNLNNLTFSSQNSYIRFPNILYIGDTSNKINFNTAGTITCENFKINNLNTQTSTFNNNTLNISFDKGLVNKIINNVDADINIINFTSSTNYGSQVIIHINPTASIKLKGKENLTVNIDGNSSNGNSYINFDSDIECSNTENTSILITATNFSDGKYFLTASLLHKK
tara:strand:+ start:32159 stop:32998 length:840 start_codon:yes stop_codon:yes gene_type:complete